MNKAILYYSHNSLPIEMEEFFQAKLVENNPDIPIIAVQKNHRTNYSSTFAAENLISICRRNNWKSILHQMNMGIECILNGSENPIVYLAEHDVLYPDTYFQYEPEHENEFLKNRNLFFANKVGFFGPFNGSIHSQTIGFAKLFRHCITEDVKMTLKFKSQDGYKLSLYSSAHSSIDIRHGFNFTGYREPRNGEYFQSLEYWGDHMDLISSIPKFKL